jgi:hypothetical protein
MSGTSNVPRPGDKCNNSSNENVSLILKKEEVDMEKTDQTTTTHSNSKTIKLSITGLLIALIPKEYLTCLSTA